MASKGKLQRILTNPRVVIVLVAFIAAVYFTGIPFSLGKEGVVISSVVKGSAAYDAGLETVEDSSLSAKELIVTIDGNKIKTLQEYADAVSGLKPNQSLLIETERAF